MDRKRERRERELGRLRQLIYKKTGGGQGLAREGDGVGRWGGNCVNCVVGKIE